MIKKNKHLLKEMKLQTKRLLKYQNTVKDNLERTKKFNLLKKTSKSRNKGAIKEV